MQLVAQRAHLSALADAGRLRTLAPRRGVDLSSNDYLALSTAPRLVAAAQAALARAGFEPDYVALVYAATLGDPARGQPARLLAAARIGTTRLIDNVAVTFE